MRKEDIEKVPNTIKIQDGKDLDIVMKCGDGPRVTIVIQRYL